jgi:hypothetical protein
VVAADAAAAAVAVDDAGTVAVAVAVAGAVVAGAAVGRGVAVGGGWRDGRIAGADAVRTVVGMVGAEEEDLEEDLGPRKGCSSCFVIA